MVDLDPTKCAEIAQTCACFNFRKASRSVTQLFDQVLAPTGLRSTQLVILLAAYLLGPTGMARLARELVMDRSTLARNLKPLQAHDFLVLVNAPGGRMKSVELTDHGRQALRDAIPYWELAQTHLVGRLGDSRWSRIMDDLGTIVDASRSSSS